MEMADYYETDIYHIVDIRKVLQMEEHPARVMNGYAQDGRDRLRVHATNEVRRLLTNRAGWLERES